MVKLTRCSIGLHDWQPYDDGSLDEVRGCVLCDKIQSRPIGFMFWHDLHESWTYTKYKAMTEKREKLKLRRRMLDDLEMQLRFIEDPEEREEIIESIWKVLAS